MGVPFDTPVIVAHDKLSAYGCQFLGQSSANTVRIGPDVSQGHTHLAEGELAIYPAG